MINPIKPRGKNTGLSCPIQPRMLILIITGPEDNTLALPLAPVSHKTKQTSQDMLDL